MKGCENGRKGQYVFPNLLLNVIDLQCIPLNICFGGKGILMNWFKVPCSSIMVSKSKMTANNGREVRLQTLFVVYHQLFETISVAINMTKQTIYDTLVGLHDEKLTLKMLSYMASPGPFSKFWPRKRDETLYIRNSIITLLIVIYLQYLPQNICFKRWQILIK